MIPYATFSYFGVTLYIVVPLIVAFAIRRRWGVAAWAGIATIAMLVVQYAGQRVVVRNHFVAELAILAGYVVVEWIVAALYLKHRAKKNTRAGFYIAVLLGLAPLLWSKIENSFFAGHMPGFGFLGISYVTFRTLDVIINIRDGLITGLPPLRYAAYLYFFPTISSGPIDRYRRFEGDWLRTRTRSDFLADFDTAIGHLMRGFFYKFIMAVLIDRYWIHPLLRSQGFAATWSYMYAYSFYLFFDFAGYSDFALAFSNLLGIRTPPNFNFPFLARNIRDFWDRWHISLSWWFRDHIYMRFVMAAMKGKWFSSRYTASHLGFLLTMGLMGVWHGFSPHYIVYGLYHAALLIGQDIFSRWNKQHKLLTGNAGAAAAWFLTFNCVCFGLLIFSGRLF